MSGANKSKPTNDQFLIVCLERKQSVHKTSDLCTHLFVLYKWKGAGQTTEALRDIAPCKLVKDGAVDAQLQYTTVSEESQLELIW